MPPLTRLLPESRAVTAESIGDALRRNGVRPCPDAAAQEFCAALSGLLLDDKAARDFPDLQALGFWLRPANISAMLRDYLRSAPGCLSSPVGTVFIIPPGNVDALFGYIAPLALLCGNAAVIRLPGAAPQAQELLVALIGRALQKIPALHDRLILLRYGHDDAITAQLSAFCDLRLVWGGDATVDHIRTIPLPPLAQQIGFGDRFSAAALDAAAYNKSDAAARADLARRFANDMYWYDQMACAAPRLLFWVGDDAACEAAAADFYPRLASAAAAMGYQPGAGESVAKLNLTYLGLHDLAPDSCKVYSPALSVLRLHELEKFSAFKSVNYGFGLLAAINVPGIEAIAAAAERRDQTLAHWGFTPEAVSALAQACLGRGYDRILPVGQALQFDPVWDGCNLFAALTRQVRAA